MDAQRWIVGLRRRCLSVQAIASVVGMDPLKVRSVLRAAGAISLGEAEVRLIGRLYQEEGCSIEELAQAAGVHPATIFKALQRSGVPRRSPGSSGGGCRIAGLSPEPGLRRRIQEARAA